MNENDQFDKWASTHRWVNTSQDALDAWQAATHRHKERIDKLTFALNQLYLETSDYITINQLGKVHHNKSMQDAQEALKEIGDV